MSHQTVANDLDEGVKDLTPDPTPVTGQAKFVMHDGGVAIMHITNLREDDAGYVLARLKRDLSGDANASPDPTPVTGLDGKDHQHDSGPANPRGNVSGGAGVQCA